MMMIWPVRFLKTVFPTRTLALLIMGGLVAVGLVYPAQAQQDRRSANMLITGCLYLVDDPVAVTQKQMEEADLCASAVASVLHFGRDLQGSMAFCPPRGTEPSDAARVIVAYLKAHPARMNERFDLLAYGALRQVWPCH
jgi:hypothetical protein